MHGLTGDDKIDLAGILAQQKPGKFPGKLDIETFLEHHEIQTTPVGDDRHQVTAARSPGIEDSKCQATKTTHYAGFALQGGDYAVKVNLHQSAAGVASNAMDFGNGYLFLPYEPT